MGNVIAQRYADLSGRPTIRFADPILARALANGFLLGHQAWYRFLDRRLRALVRHAAQNVPFYRRLYHEAGIDIAAFRGIADFEKLPIVGRRQLQDCPLEDRIARGCTPSQLVARSTSGSSGMPLRIMRTRAEDLLLQAVRLRARHTTGLRPWQRTARVDLTHRVKTEGVRQLTAVSERRGLFPFQIFDAFADATLLATSIAAYRPTLLAGQPSFLERLCTEANTAQLAAIRVSLISTGGETLTPGARTLLENTFQAPIIDYYGSHEFNLIAWQRVADGPYELANLVTVGEVFASERDPLPTRRVGECEHGEFVGTALWSWASPFIRYRLGDEVMVDKLDSETGLCLSLREIRGRITDYFVTRSGQMQHIYQVISPLLQSAPWLRRYRIEQHEAGSLSILVTPSCDVSADMVLEAQQQINRTLAESVTVSLCRTDRIQASASGKCPLFLRHIALPTKHAFSERQGQAPHRF